MYKNWVIAVCCLVTTNAVAAEPPEYKRDPFNDNELIKAPLILDVAYPTNGRAEMSLSFSGTTSKYHDQVGALLSVEYFLLETLGLGFSGGYYHGQLSTIVTDAQGVLGNKMRTCLDSPGAVCDSVIQPDLPDYRQLTGVLDLYAIWVPLYGKLNIVSEVDVNLQLYLLAGFGVNGTRVPVAVPSARPSHEMDYTISNGGIGEGGFLSEPRFNMTAGAGIKMFVSDRISLKAEMRWLAFGDKFDFDFDGKDDNYLSMYWFGQAGLSFVLF